jgi:hypothetical protein
MVGRPDNIMTRINRTNNDLQNTTQKAKNRTTWTLYCIDIDRFFID